MVCCWVCCCFLFPWSFCLQHVSTIMKPSTYVPATWTQASAALAEMTTMAPTPMTTMGTGPSRVGGWPCSQNLKKWWLIATHHNWSQVLSCSKEMQVQVQVLSHLSTQNSSWVFDLFVLFFFHCGRVFYCNYIYLLQIFSVVFTGCFLLRPKW